MSERLVTIRMLPKFHATASAYGRLVQRHSELPGSHRTPAAEAGNDLLSHVKGKYGELAFMKWLMSEGMLPSHTPFRNDYTRKVVEDDFIVNGIRIEVKAKRRRESSPFPPPANYNVNLGKSGLEASLYVFIEISPKASFEDGPPCLMLGWADQQLIRSVGVRTEPGTRSDAGNFTFKRHDWDIAIGKLREAAGLLVLLRAASDATCGAARPDASTPPP